MRDVVIIGSGCAGLIYDRREDLRAGIIPCGGLFHQQSGKRVRQLPTVGEQTGCE
jgi:hypothetical protein